MTERGTEMAEMMMAVMDYLPVGYRFHPTDEELLWHYLRGKNLGEYEPICVIPEVDLCSWEPEDLRGKFLESSVIRSKDLELWFFCEQKPGPTQQRSTKKGYWKITGPTRDVRTGCGTKEVIGSKKILTFFRGNSSNSTKTDWVMHEYHLPAYALDGRPPGISKNYVVCMIKCKSDEMANPPPSYGCEQEDPVTINIVDLLEQEDDNGFIPEDLIEATVQSLETELQPTSVQFPRHSHCSADSSLTESSFGRDSMDFHSPFSSTEDINTLAFLDEDDNMYETSMPHQQQVIIMENKQTHRANSLPAFLPIGEKQGIVEDDFRQPSAYARTMETPKVKSEKQSTKIVLSKSIEAKALKQAPGKIKVEIASAGSSSTCIRKPRLPVTAAPVERNVSADTTKKKEINTISAPSNPEEPAQETKPTTAITKPLTHSPTCSGRKCSCSNIPMVHFQNTVVGIILCIAIFCEIFNLQF